MAHWCKEKWSEGSSSNEIDIQEFSNVLSTSRPEAFNISMSGRQIWFSRRRQSMIKLCILLFVFFYVFGSINLRYSPPTARMESGKVELQWFLSKFGNRGDYKLLELFLLPCNQSLLHLKLVKYFVFLKYGILCILDRGKMENPPMSTSIRDEKVNIQFRNFERR